IRETIRLRKLQEEQKKKAADAEAARVRMGEDNPLFKHHSKTITASRQGIGADRRSTIISTKWTTSSPNEEPKEPDSKKGSLLRNAAEFFKDPDSRRGSLARSLVKSGIFVGTNPRQTEHDSPLVEDSKEFHDSSEEGRHQDGSVSSLEVPETQSMSWGQADHGDHHSH
ncbi:hypothetical protein BC830DRAFT_1088207, partial [Chytriomyces sp. MP71]